MYAACAAQSCAAAELGSGQLQSVAQDPQQWSVGLNVNTFCDAVYFKRKGWHGLGKPENILEQIREQEQSGKGKWDGQNI
jgi:hypothetical protein